MNAIRVLWLPLVWKLETVCHVAGKIVYPSSRPVGEQRIIWLVRCWLINVMRWLWYLLFFCLISPSWVMHLIMYTMPWTVFLPLRLSRIGTFAMFWCLESYYIIITDILWCDLHLNTPVTDHMTSIMLSNCICLLPCSIWNAWHAWTLTLTLHSIMILHQREREPMFFVLCSLFLFRKV